MRKCDSCGTTIVIGGREHHGKRFCNDKCYQDGFLMTTSQQIPASAVRKEVEEVHQGNCPQCSRKRPVDIHMVYNVFSMVRFTRWSNKVELSCRPCAVRSQIGNLLFSLLFGWWGIPTGLIMTPIQVTRNFIALVRPPDPTKPSAKLEKFVRLHLAAQLVNHQQTAGRPDFKPTDRYR
jgi:hypothetical protein